jgi:hypothetical protein
LCSFTKVFAFLSCVRFSALQFVVVVFFSLSFLSLSVTCFFLSFVVGSRLKKKEVHILLRLSLLGFCFSFSEETLGILVSPSVYPVNFLYRKSCGIPTGGEVVPCRAGAAVEAEEEETWKGSL